MASAAAAEGVYDQCGVGSGAVGLYPRGNWHRLPARVERAAQGPLYRHNRQSAMALKCWGESSVVPSHGLPVDVIARHGTSVPRTGTFGPWPQTGALSRLSLLTCRPIWNLLPRSPAC